MMRLVVYLLLLLFFSQELAAQSPRNDTIPSVPRESEVPVDKNSLWLNDTTSLRRKHSPKKATILSAIVPGLGQVYNRQYYKVPVIGGLAAFFAIMISTNDFDLTQANNNLNTRIDNDALETALPKTMDSVQLFRPESLDYYDARKNKYYPGSATRILTTDNLRVIRDQYRRERDFYIIMSAVVYALNIVDATVFAHLREFEINDKLSMKIDPDVRFLRGYTNPYTGITLSLNFHHSK